jgi:hypothetical protein
MQIRGGALQKAPPSKTILISVHVEGTGPESILLVLIKLGCSAMLFSERLGALIKIVLRL